MMTKVKNFFSEVKVELQKCSWPWDPKEKGFPPLQGTGGLDHRGCHRDAVARWLRGVVRFYPGERRALLHPIALIYGTNTRSERSMVRCACAFRSGKQSAREHCETRQNRRDGRLVYDVLLPTERVSEIKKGKKTETTRNFSPVI
jgi:hypothetical protein